MRKNIAVVFGGKSCENEISIITGVMAVNLLDPERYAAFPVYLSQAGDFYTGAALSDASSFRREGYLQKGKKALFCGQNLCTVHKNKIKTVAKIDCVLNCCHGMGGEDGALSSLLDLNGIPNASPDAAPSALFMDKTLTKLVAKALGVKTAP